MDYTELLFAAQIYDLATKIRGASIPDDVPQEDFPNWKLGHPVSDYVEKALNRIQTTADQIRELRKQ
jgi:hypothetical protein